jgi:general secretion pathway protein I
MRKLKRQHGFTLLEAIVALVLLGTTGMALFSWINSNIITLNRIQEVNAKNAVTINAVEYMEKVNPSANPTGKASFGTFELHWESQPIHGPRDGANYPYGIGLHQLALYQTKVTVSRPEGQYWFDFMLNQVGHLKVRELSFDN